MKKEKTPPHSPPCRNSKRSVWQIGIFYRYFWGKKRFFPVLFKLVLECPPLSGAPKRVGWLFFPCTPGHLSLCLIICIISRVDRVAGWKPFMTCMDYVAHFMIPGLDVYDTHPVDNVSQQQIEEEVCCILS